jgi:LruC domain-containing protein
MNELKVSSNFNWQTGKDVTVKINSPINGMLIISSIDESMLFYKGFYNDTSKNNIIIVSIPSYLNQIKINSQIATVNGNSVVINKLSNNKSLSLINYSLHLNGTTDWVAIPNSGGITLNNAFTLEAWVKADIQHTCKIIEKGDWDGFSIGQDLWNGWMASVAMNNLQAHTIYWGNGQPVLNKWYHIAATYNGTSFNLYVDGVLKSTSSTIGTMNYTHRTISIGSDNGNQKFFKGYIDDVAFWTKSLSTNEIIQGMNLGWNGSENGLLAYWKFNEGNGTILQNTVSSSLSGNLIGAFSLETGYGVDNDNDGVLNGYDDYPNDASRAFNNYFPSNGFGSLAFEDLWPNMGDYDFNDLVVDYSFRNITNSNNKLVETYATFVLKAAGASYKNGFGFQFANNLIAQNAINVSGYKVYDNYISLNSNGLESNQSKPTFIVFDNVFKCMPNISGGIGFNTSANMAYLTPDTIVLHITYTPNLYTLDDLNISAFNPFMIINENRGKEVHLIDHPPTSLANPALFGTFNDASIPLQNKYYRSKTNLPWALNIYETFNYPFEKTDILKAYLNMADWAQSSGALYTDWFQNKTAYRNSTFIYNH